MTDDATNETRQFGCVDGNDETALAIESTRGDLDRLSDLLAEPRCRHIVSYLSETAVDAVELTDLVAAVVSRESDSGGGIDHYEAVAIDAHLTHLPKLEAAGLLEYDARSRTVRYYGDPRLEEALAVVSESESRSGETRNDD